MMDKLKHNNSNILFCTSHMKHTLCENRTIEQKCEIESSEIKSAAAAEEKFVGAGQQHSREMTLSAHAYVHVQCMIVVELGLGLQLKKNAEMHNNVIKNDGVMVSMLIQIKTPTVSA